MYMHSGIGIDFGTSNTLVASFDEEKGSEILPIPQLIEKDTMHRQDSLPSAVLINNQEIVAVGEYARKQGSIDPEHTILSVKSWLCNSLVSRHEAILPWGGDEEIQKYAPTRIASEIIRYAISEAGKALSIDIATQNEVKKVLTIPASFDEIARQLTEQAARDAGLTSFIFLEEPLAALYAWLAQHEDDWREHLSTGDMVLVCDIGGGTTDFTLVGVGEAEGALSLERYSVGEHILLGGDNMDLALAYLLTEEAETDGKPLDPWQQKAVIQILRELKEKALSEEGADEDLFHLAIPSRSSNLFAQSVRFSLPRSFFLKNTLEGFFPIIESNEEKESEETGISDAGLPYESDPRFTVHLLEFLKQSYRTITSSSHLDTVIDKDILDKERGIIRPTKILFNGGVFNSLKAQERILAQLQHWFPERTLETLPSQSLDESVARGAAFFSALKTSGKKIPIKAGVAHSLYLGIKENKLAVPGIKPKLKGICVLPQGSTEGSEFILKEIPLNLKKGKTSEFTLFSSRERVDDMLGSVVSDAEQNLNKLHTISSSIPLDSEDESLVPVTLRVKATEIGSLEIWMDEINKEHSHQVEFKIR
jgi:hypothetical protein